MRKVWIAGYYRLNKPVALGSWFSDIVVLITRVICGLMLSIDFGASKFGMPWTPDDRKLGFFEVIYWFPQDVAEYGGLFAMFPAFFAWMGAFSEAVGGLLLAVGFNTRITSFLIACTMLVAIFCQQWQNGTWGMLPALGFLWVSLYGMALGAGRLSMDYLLWKRYTKKSKLHSIC